jgi:site-specific recombinase XerD
MVARGKTQQSVAFRKVGSCLYRYRNGTYYARFKCNGKEILRSLQTTDRKLAERNLADTKEQQSYVDQSQGKLTLEGLCDRYLKTVQHQKPKTVERKTFIVSRIKSNWPTGKLTQVAKIKPSDVDVWLSCYRFGAASRNLHISCIKEVFGVALRDRIITVSPAAHLHSARRARPIRLSPTYEQFKAIVVDVRAQQFNPDAQESGDFLEFLGLVGVGQAEASSLKRSDIDLDSGRMITFRQKTATGFAIPIFPQARPLLERLCVGKSNDDSIFKIRDAKRALAGACRRLKLPPFSQRSLRRMFVTRAIEKGIDVKVIAEWQGHKDGGKLILDTYSHVNRAHSDRMAQLMLDTDSEAPLG